MSEAREHEHLWLGDLRKMPDGQARLYSRGGRLISGAFNADRRAAMSLSRDVTGKPFLPASVTTDDLRDLLDDDATGAASGEGEK